MRGQVDQALSGFLSAVNQAIAEAQTQGLVYSPTLARARLQGLAQFVSVCPEIAYAADQQLRLTAELWQAAVHTVTKHLPMADCLAQSAMLGVADIPVRVYSPAPNECLPVLLYYHGGGHMCGDLGLYEPICRQLALAAHCVVVSVGYRLAPEQRFPAGVVDAYAALLHVESLLNDVGYLSQFSVAGDSAGGALAATVALLAGARVSKQLLIYPSLDYSMSQPSISENGQGFLLERSRIAWYFDNYFPAGLDAQLAAQLRQAASPLWQLRALTPAQSATMAEALVISAGCDPLRDEAQAYAELLAQHAVPVQLLSFEGMIHAFINLHDLVPEHCARLYDAAGTFLRPRPDATELAR